MEPLVAQCLEVTALFQTGVFIVDGIDEFLVVAHNTYLAVRNVDRACDQCVDGQFLLLPVQWPLAPDEIVVAPLADACQGFLGRAIDDGNVQMALVHDAVGSVVVEFEHERVFGGEVGECRHLPGSCGRDDLHLVVIQDIGRADVGPSVETVGGVDNQVCIAAFEGLRSLAPLAENDAVGNVKFLEDRLQ